MIEYIRKKPLEAFSSVVQNTTGKFRQQSSFPYALLILSFLLRKEKSKLLNKIILHIDMIALCCIIDLDL